MNKRKVMLAIGILSMNLLIMSGTVVGAAIAVIAESFPNEPISKVQMLSSISQLGQIAATLLFTWVTYKITKKNIGLISVAIVAISGLIPVFYNNSINIILACMVALGVGVGFIANVSPVLLREHFDGEDRASVMGWSIGVNSFGRMAFTAIGGVLGRNSWTNLFWVYGAAIIVLLMVWITVPKDVKNTQADSKDQSKSSIFEKLYNLNGYIFAIFLITFFTSLVITTFIVNQSILLHAKGNGTAYTASVTAAGSIGGICTAFGLKYIRKLTKTNTIAWGFLAFALSYACIAFFGNPLIHVFGNIVSGMGIVLVNATIPFELSLLTSHDEFPAIIAMNTFVSSIAGVAAPILLAAINIPAGSASFFAGIILSVITALTLFSLQLGRRIENSCAAKAQSS